MFRVKDNRFLLVKGVELGSGQKQPFSLKRDSNWVQKGLHSYTTSRGLGRVTINLKHNIIFMLTVPSEFGIFIVLMRYQSLVTVQKQYCFKKITVSLFDFRSQNP